MKVNPETSVKLYDEITQESNNAPIVIFEEPIKIKRRKLKYNLKQCQEIAAGCANKKAFEAKNYYAFKSAELNDWLKILFPRKKSCEKIITEEAIIKDIIIEEEVTVINNQINVIEEIKEKNADGGKQRNGRTKSDAIEIANKFTTLSDFIAQERTLYFWLLNKGWLEEITAHMKRGKRKRGISFEYIKEITDKITIKSDFYYGEKSLYTIAQRNGWLPQLMAHMVDEDDQEERLIYVFEFNNNHCYVGMTKEYRTRFKTHVGLRQFIKKDSNSPVLEYIKNNPTINYAYMQLTDKMNMYEAAEQEKYYIAKYKEDGWIMLNRNKGGAPGRGAVIWTKKRCREFAIQCDTAKELSDLCRGAYLKILKMDWVEELCSHMSIKPVKYSKQK